MGRKGIARSAGQTSNSIVFIAYPYRLLVSKGFIPKYLDLGSLLSRGKYRTCIYIYTRVDSRLDSWNSGNLADTILPIFDPDRKKAGFRAGFHSRDSGLRDIEANRGNCFR